MDISLVSDFDYINILKYWFDNQNVWFSASNEDDLFIHNEFSHLLLNDITIWNKHHTSCLAYIILFDQFPYHIFRDYNTEKIEYYHQFSLNATFYGIENGYHFKYTHEELCFFLLPLRHSKILKYTTLCINIIKFFRDKNDSSTLRRFYKNCLIDYAKIINNKLQPSVLSIDDNNIANYCCKFYPSFNTNNLTSNPIFTRFKEYCRQYDIKSATISLSGGVDSMITSFILSFIVTDLRAIHINYNNRPESIYESQFVQWWCNKLNIPCFIRDITEISRNKSIDRNIYESVTNFIRFNLYSLKSNDIPVFLGHNKDDTIENIFTNIYKQTNFNNLKGMFEYDVIKQSIICRPMLNISKKDIYNFAHHFNISYLHDSTPKWSQRGKIRDYLIPAIHLTNSSIIDGIINISNTQTSMFNIIYNNILSPFIKSFIFYSDHCNIISLNKSYYEYGIFFWKVCFQKIFSHFDKNIPSNKAILNFIKLAKHYNTSKHYTILLTKTSYIKLSDNTISVYVN